MIYTAYRTEPIITGAWSNSALDGIQRHGTYALGYLTYDSEARKTTRYTPEGKVIDVQGPAIAWQNADLFMQWFRQHSDTWTLDPCRAYFCADPDLLMDEGL